METWVSPANALRLSWPHGPGDMLQLLYQPATAATDKNFYEAKNSDFIESQNCDHMAVNGSALCL